jgi:PAS domain S-box-containing protein
MRDNSWNPIFLVLLFSFIYYGWIYGVSDAELMQLGANVLQTAAPLISACLLLHRAWRKRVMTEPEPYLLILGLANLMYLIGQLLWDYYEMIKHIDTPTPSIADIFYFAYAILILVGILFTFSKSKGSYRGIQLLLDVMMIMVAAFSLSWEILIKPLLLQYEGEGMILRFFVVGYPVLDLGILFGLLILLLSVRQFQGDIVLMGIGIGCYLIADTVFTYRTMHVDYYTGEWTDPLWSLGILLMGISPLYNVSISIKKQQLKDSPGPQAHLLRTVFPYILTGAMYVLIHISGWEIGLAAEILILILVIRQVVTLVENHRLVHALHKSREQYRVITNNTREIIFQTDHQGHFIFLNDSWETITGYTTLESLGRPFLEYVHPADLESVQLRYPKMLQMVYPTIMEQLRWVTKDGSVLWFEISAQNTYASGGLRSTSGILKNITDKKATEERLAQDLSLAKQLQESLLPTALRDSGIQMEALFRASNNLSGDMYDWFRISEHKYGMYLLDVTGHGITSSLISISIRSMFETLMHTHQDCESVVRQLNQYMLNTFSSTGKPMYFSCICLTVDLKQNVIEYVNAGHPPAYLFDLADTSLLKLESTCTLVGVIPDLIPVKRRIPITSSYRMIVYSDGMLHVLRELSMRELRETPSKELLAQLAEAYSVTDMPEEDDYCAVIVELQTMKAT